MIEPPFLWHRRTAFAATIYFKDKPVASIWDDVDEFAYIGHAMENEVEVTGVKIEHFSKWLVAAAYDAPMLKSA